MHRMRERPRYQLRLEIDRQQPRTQVNIAVARMPQSSCPRWRIQATSGGFSTTSLDFMPTFLSALLLVTSQPLPATDGPTRRVCLAQLGRAAGRADPRAYGGYSNFPEFRVDFGSGQVVTAQPDVTVRAPMSIGARHQIVVTRSMVTIATFSFTFEEHGLHDLCLWYDPRRHKWSLQSVASAPHRFAQAVSARKNETYYAPKRPCRETSPVQSSVAARMAA